MNNISQYVPPCYKKVRELKTIYDVETLQLQDAESIMFQVASNYFIQHCDIDTIASWEEVLHIIPQSTDTLEIRRQKVLFAIMTTPPYTDIFLHQLLSNYVEEYRVEIDSINCEITIYIIENNLSLIRFLKQLLIPIIPIHFSFDIVVGTEVDLEDTLYIGCAVSTAIIVDIGG